MRMELFKESCDGCFHDKQPQGKAVASKKAISQYLCQSICSLESKTNFYIYPYTSYPIFILVGVVEQKKLYYSMILVGTKAYLPIMGII